MEDSASEADGTRLRLDTCPPNCWTLSVAERARLYVDRHVVPGETKSRVRAEAEAAVDDLESEVTAGFREAPADDVHYGPYVTDPDHPLVEPSPMRRAR